MLALPLTSRMTLGKVLNPSEHQLPQLSNEDDIMLRSTYLLLGVILRTA